MLRRLLRLPVFRIGTSSNSLIVQVPPGSFFLVAGRFVVFVVEMFVLVLGFCAALSCITVCFSCTSFLDPPLRAP